MMPTAVKKLATSLDMNYVDFNYKIAFDFSPLRLSKTKKTLLPMEISHGALNNDNDLTASVDSWRFSFKITMTT